MKLKHELGPFFFSISVDFQSENDFCRSTPPAPVSDSERIRKYTQTPPVSAISSILKRVLQVVFQVAGLLFNPLRGDGSSITFGAFPSLELGF